MLTQAEVVPGALTLPGVTRDPKDDAVVACAVEGAAGFVVSGDEDLLVLCVYQDVEMVTPRGLVDILEKAIRRKRGT
jgi:predicted nucleic acid-binding protein